MKRRRIVLSLLALAWPVLAAPKSAARAEPYFSSKTVTIFVGYSPGGGYDLYARDLARYFGLKTFLIERETPPDPKLPAHSSS